MPRPCHRDHPKPGDKSQRVYQCRLADIPGIISFHRSHTPHTRIRRYIHLTCVFSPRKFLTVFVPPFHSVPLTQDGLVRSFGRLVAGQDVREKQRTIYNRQSATNKREPETNVENKTNFLSVPTKNKHFSPFAGFRFSVKHHVFSFLSVPTSFVVPLNPKERGMCSIFLSFYSVRPRFTCRILCYTDSRCFFKPLDRIRFLNHSLVHDSFECSVFQTTHSAPFPLFPRTKSLKRVLESQDAFPPPKVIYC